MRKNKIVLLFCLLCWIVESQENDDSKKSINDFNFESVTNPAFILLDETPTSISTPDNLKSLALYVSNGFSDNNIALEVNPYWILGGNDDTSYREYRGIKDDDKIDPFKSLETNTTLSLAYLDKEFQNIEGERKVFAVGLRTTIAEVYGKRTSEIVGIIKSLEGGYENDIMKSFDTYVRRPGANLISPDVAKCKDFETNKKAYEASAIAFLNNNPAYKRQYSTSDKLLEAYFKGRCARINNFYLNKKNIKPIFRLDGALGYSVLFKENDVDASTANRFGSWLTADLAIKFTDQNYLHAYGIGKYIDDGFVVENDGTFGTTAFWDYGGKIELELERFKFSYEYLRREGDGEQFRSVGNITFQLNQTMSITGGFGKDFPQDDNLVSLIGVNWGLNLGEKAFTNK